MSEKDSNILQSVLADKLPAEKIRAFSKLNELPDAGQILSEIPFVMFEEVFKGEYFEKAKEASQYMRLQGTALNAILTHRREIANNFLSKLSPEHIVSLIEGKCLSKENRIILFRLLVERGAEAASIIPYLRQVADLTKFVQRSSHSDEYSRAMNSACLETLRKIDTEETRGFLESYNTIDLKGESLKLFHSNKLTRYRAALEIRLAGTNAIAVLPELRKALDDPEFTVQREVCEAIGSIGPLAESATEDLVKAAKANPGIVRASAIAALQKIGTSDAVRHAHTLTELTKRRDDRALNSFGVLVIIIGVILLMLYMR